MKMPRFRVVHPTGQPYTGGWIGSGGTVQRQKQLARGDTEALGRIEAQRITAINVQAGGTVSRREILTFQARYGAGSWERYKPTPTPTQPAPSVQQLRPPENPANILRFYQDKPTPSQLGRTRADVDYSRLYYDKSSGTSMDYTRPGDIERKRKITQDITKYEEKFGGLEYTRTPSEYGISYIEPTTTVPKDVAEYTKGKKTKPDSLSTQLTQKEFLFGSLTASAPEKIESMWTRRGLKLGVLGKGIPTSWSAPIASYGYVGVGTYALGRGVGVGYTALATTGKVIKYTTKFPKLTTGLGIGTGVGMGGFAGADIGYTVYKGDYPKAIGKGIRDITLAESFVGGQKLGRLLGKTPTIPTSDIRAVTTAVRISKKKPTDMVDLGEGLGISAKAFEGTDIKPFSIKAMTEVETRRGYGFLGRKKSFFIESSGDLATRPISKFTTPEGIKMTYDEPKAIGFKGLFKTPSDMGIKYTRTVGLGTVKQTDIGGLHLSAGIMKGGGVPTLFKGGIGKAFKYGRAGRYDIYFGETKLISKLGKPPIKTGQYTFFETTTPKQKQDLGYTFYRRKAKPTKFKLFERTTKPFAWMSKDKPIDIKPLDISSGKGLMLKQDTKLKLPSLPLPRQIVSSQVKELTKVQIQNIPKPTHKFVPTWIKGKTTSGIIYTPSMSKLSKVGQIRQQIYTPATISLPKTKTITLGKTRRGQISLPKTISITKSKLGTLQLQTPIQAQAQKQKIRQIYKLQTPSITTTPQIISIPSFPRPPPPPIILPFGLGMGGKLKTRGFGAVQTFGYVPDYASLVFGRRGKKYTGIKTGFEIRPIPKGFSIAKLKLKKVYRRRKKKKR